MRGLPGEGHVTLDGEVADGVLMLVGLNPRSVDPAALEEILLVPFGPG